MFFIVGKIETIGRGCAPKSYCKDLHLLVDNNGDFYCGTCEEDLCNGDNSFRVVAIYIFLALVVIAASGMTLWFTGKYIAKALRICLS